MTEALIQPPPPDSQATGDRPAQRFTADRPSPFPDHTQLPESDGSFVKNFQEHPQSILLTDSILPVLDRIHPDGQYAIGQDCGLYWRETDPPEKGAEAPDWFYVPGVPPRINGEIRRSYVIWREFVAPTIALEFASGDGSEERDRTPLSSGEEGSTRPGKFWVYERIARIPYYGIFIVNTGQLELYELVGGVYQPMVTNDRGHYPIPPLQAELGVWQGCYQNEPDPHPWLRWWDLDGNLLLIGSERAEIAEQRADTAEQRADTAEQRADTAEQRADTAEQKAARLAERLRQLGIDPEEV
jgi:Uma2 family endonuclease